MTDTPWTAWDALLLGFWAAVIVLCAWAERRLARKQRNQWHRRP